VGQRVDLSLVSDDREKCAMANLSTLNKDQNLDSLMEGVDKRLSELDGAPAMPERTADLLEQNREQDKEREPALSRTELEKFLHSTEQKPESSAGFSPFLTPKGDPVFGGGKAYFGANYGTQILHSGLPGNVVELKSVPNGTEKEVIIEADNGTRYSYYGIGGAGLKVGDEVKSGQMLSYAKMHFDAVDSVGVQVSVTNASGENITKSAFSKHNEIHPMAVAAEKSVSTEKPVSLRSEFSKSDIDKAAHQVFAGDRRTLVSTISPLPTLEKASYRPFVGFDGLGAPEHLKNGIVVNGLDYGDQVVSPMAGKIIHQKNEPNDTLAVSVQMENGDIMTFHGLTVSPKVGTEVQAGRSLGYVATTSGELIISTQTEEKGGIPHRPSYYLNRPNLMEASRTDWSRD
jgi:biotin carboxyl carrier protein